MFCAPEDSEGGFLLPSEITGGKKFFFFGMGLRGVTSALSRGWDGKGRLGGHSILEVGSKSPVPSPLTLASFLALPRPTPAPLHSLGPLRCL